MPITVASCLHHVYVRSIASPGPVPSPVPSPSYAYTITNSQKKKKKKKKNGHETSPSLLKTEDCDLNSNSLQDYTSTSTGIYRSQ